MTFFRIVRHSSMTGFWNAMPTVARGDFTRSPCSQTSPSSGFISPAISRVSVDLPQPEGPTTATNPPSGTETARAPQRAGLGLESVGDGFDFDQGGVGHGLHFGFLILSGGDISEQEEVTATSPLLLRGAPRRRRPAPAPARPYALLQRRSGRRAGRRP